MKRVGLFVALLCLCLWANAGEFMFKHLEVKDGLSNNQVNNIFRDSEGFMWFSTASGLNRFDGYEVKIFRSYDMEAGPFPDNYIEDVQEDFKGRLWVRTAAGYSVYDPATESFNRDVRTLLLETGIDGTPALTYIDSNKNMWFYIPSKGCYSYMPESQLMYPLLFDAGQLPEGAITDMAECEDGLLMVYGNGLLLCLDKETNKVKWQLEDISKEQRGNKPEAFKLFVDGDGDVWIYNTNGVWVYNPAQKAWLPRFANMVGQQSRGGIYAISQGKAGNIWIGRNGDGLNILNKQAGTIKTLKNISGDERSLPDNTITALYEDEAGSMWVGSRNKGVSYYNESTFKFNQLPVGNTTGIEEDAEGYLWLGVDAFGLLRLNAATGMHQVMANEPSNAPVACLYRANDNKMWIGTSGGGLSCYENGRFFNYRNMPGDDNSLALNHVSTLTGDGEGNIWIGTAGAGVQSLNPRTGQFTSYTAYLSDLLSDQVSSLAVTQGNVLLIGTSKGLSMLDLGSKKVTNFVTSKSGKTRLSNLNINQVFEDSRGLIWIGTCEGLNIYNPKTDELKVLGMDEGLPNGFVAAIAEDNNKNMWVTTAKGVAALVPLLDSKTGDYSFSIRIYDDRDGLQNSDFNQRSIKKLASGDMLMGGIYGINRVNPDDIKYNTVLPQVLFTELSLFNKPVEIGKKYGDVVVLGKALNMAGEIELDYTQNIFSVQFASDSYVLPEKVQYVHKLEGFNNDWLASDGRKVTYTNLSPGTYTLKVKAINSDGYSGDKEASLKIIIRPPFWLSFWAYLIYAALLVIVLLIGRSLVLRGERKRVKMNQAEAAPVSEKPVRLSGTVRSEKNAGQSIPPKREQVEVESDDDEEVVVVRTAQKGAEVQPAATKVVKEEKAEEKNFIITIENVAQVVAARNRKSADSDEEETVFQPEELEEDADIVTTIQPQRATVIQLMEDDSEEIVTRILPPEELPETAAARLMNKIGGGFTSEAVKQLIKKEKTAENGMEEITSADEKLIEKAMKYVEKNISRSDFSVEELSHELGMSRVHLYKKLLAITGRTPIEFIRIIRLRRAAQLLSGSRQNVSEIAFQLGFNNPKYFSKYFKEEFGMLPSVYQEKERR